MAEPASKAIKMLGGFELITKIGQGGMGTVFKARQISLDRDVALKILPPKIAQSDPVFIERFIREARTSAKLNHPNIVQGIEVGKDDISGLYYFAMEYIDGATVKVLLKQGPLPEKRALEIGMGVTQALICAHRAGIVHRDIKPDNILLTSRGEAKLADLGLARHALDTGPDETGKDDVFGVRRGNAELTQAGAAVGTPSYMAPEQIKAELDKIDARTDLYALGATLFHMVTGRMPYVGDNSRAIMMQHLTAAVPDPRSVNPAVSEPLSKLIMKLLQKESNKRVSSAEELAKELDRMLNGGPAEKIRRGTGKQSPVRDSGRLLAIKDGSKPPTGDQSSYRTHASGETARGVNKGTKSHQPVTSKKVLYIGVSVAVLACCGIVYAFFAGSTPATNKATPPPLPVADGGSNGKSDSRTPPAGQTATGATASAEKWPLLEKARQAAREKPQDFANNLKLLDEAEKGAPQDVVLFIRHDRSVIEHDRDAAFRKTLDELIHKARETVGGGKADFVTALSLFKDGALPDALLNDANRAEFNRVRVEFEAQTFNAFRSVADGIEYDVEHSAADSVPKLRALLDKLDPLSKQYPVKAVQERLARLRKAINEQMLVATANMGLQQESTFCRSVEAAWSAARNSDYNDGLKALAAVRGDQTLNERFGGRVDVLKRDLETVRDLVQKSTNVLNAKLNSKEDLVLHPVGGQMLGKITAKDKDGNFTFETRDAGEQTIDPDRLDPQDLLFLNGNKAEGAERKYLIAICSFWQGRPQKAYDYFSQVKKESSESGDAGVYLGFMNFRATEMMAKITEYFHEVQNNSDLSPEQKKAKQADAQALMVKLKTDFSNTEAYLARKQKK